MRAEEFLIESIITKLNPRDLTKGGPDRVNTLIGMIKKGTPLYLVDGTPITIKKTEAKRILDLYNNDEFIGRINLLGTDGKEYGLGNFLKTKEFGGFAVPPNQDTGDIPVAGIKPSTTFGHKNPEKEQEVTATVAINLGGFPAKDLAKNIISNKHLKTQGPTGLAVIQIAKELNSGKYPMVPQLTDPEIKNIQNYAYEYLGPLALINGVVDFPNSADFYNHVGGDLSNLILYFPSNPGNPLVDSFAFVNKKTGNHIGISSKGASGGQASSIVGLKIKDEQRPMIGKDPALTFINLIQTTEAWKQPFVAVNWIHENYPGYLGELEKFLPFDERFFNWAGSIIVRNSTVPMPRTLAEIPGRYTKLYKLVDKNGEPREKPLFYYLRNYVKDNVLNKLTQGNSNPIPNFNERMLELLGENFMVLNTGQDGPKNAKYFHTSVHWPALIRGKVVFYQKDGPDKWKSSITWKLI